MGRSPRPDLSRAEKAVTELLDALGIDTRDPALAKTPKIVARAYADVLLGGYREDPIAALGKGFPVKQDGPVIAANIPIMFVCPHHLMPAHGIAHVAFHPRARVPGLARIAKLVDVLAHRLVLQEDLSAGIVEALARAFDVRAALAVIEASHTCVAVEDYARRATRFRTRATHGPAKLVRALERELRQAIE